MICQLESSGRWPEDLDALRMMKVAFYINMAKGLRESKVLASPTKNYLDILKVRSWKWQRREGEKSAKEKRGIYENVISNCAFVCVCVHLEWSCVQSKALSPWRAGAAKGEVE